MNNLKGYTEQQRNLAYAIRGRVVSKFNLSDPNHARVHERLMKVTSPMFFIKYESILKKGQVIQALRKYDQDNYNRRARFVTKGK